MRRTTGLIAILALLGAGAPAQAQTGVLCARSIADWAKVANGQDVIKMNHVIGNMPSVCAALQTQAVARRDAVVHGLSVHRTLAANLPAPQPPAVQQEHVFAEVYMPPAVGAEPQAAAAAPAPAAPSTEPADAQGLSAYARHDYEAAMRSWRQAVKEGDTDAPAWIAWLYEKGLGVPADYAQARTWYDMAAALGNANGLAGVGDLYRFHEGVPQDYGQAMSWYRKAAALKNAYAENSIAELYENGLGMPADPKAARTWYEKAAADGSADAKSWLAGHPN